MAAADYGYLWEDEEHMKRARGKCTIKIAWTDAFRAGEHAFFREKRVQAREIDLNTLLTVVQRLLIPCYYYTC